MKQPILLLLGAALLAACHKESDSAPQPESSSYLPLKTGNYWVYRQYAIDGSTGQATATSVLDSCFVSKDTLIRGNVYYKLVRPHFTGSSFFTDNRYLRDSLHYIIDRHGRRLFSSQDRSTVFSRDYVTVDPRTTHSDTVCEIKAQMAPQPTAVTTPAGSFTTQEYQQVFRYYLPYSQFHAPRSMHTRYAENVGIVTETLPFYLSNPGYTERRLVRYRVK